VNSVALRSNHNFGSKFIHIASCFQAKYFRSERRGGSLSRMFGHDSTLGDSIKPTGNLSKFESKEEFLANDVKILSWAQAGQVQAQNVLACFQAQSKPSGMARLVLKPSSRLRQAAQIISIF
jgi:hypothetical protein